MTTVYTDHYKVSSRIQGKWALEVSLSSDSGVSQANKDRINIANTAPFTAGDLIRITDSSEQTGEDLVIGSIVADSYLVTTTDMTKDYTTSNDAVVQIKSMFSNRTQPSKSDVEIFINEAEDYIDNRTKHGWREKTVTQEYHPIRTPVHTLIGVPVVLNHRKIKTLSTSSGDKIEIWNGSTWEDWLTTRSEGRNSDFWMNYTDGILYVRAYYLIHTELACRVTYRYGEVTVPKDIQQACTLLASADVIESDNYTAKHPAGDLDNVPVETKAERWRRRAELLIDSYKEYVSVGL